MNTKVLVEFGFGDEDSAAYFGAVLGDASRVFVMPHGADTFTFGAGTFRLAPATQPIVPQPDPETGHPTYHVVLDGSITFRWNPGDARGVGDKREKTNEAG